MTTAHSSALQKRGSGAPFASSDGPGALCAHDQAMAASA
jgi:hypothetical protein